MSNRSPEVRVRMLRLCALAIAICLGSGTGGVMALPTDRDQPINIIADKAVRDDKQGFTVYSGDVRMDQGSMHIEADKLTIYHAEEDVEKIVAEGRPARMRQQPELDKGIVYARAHTIEYFKGEERVHLKTNASIEQDGGTVTGDSIDYFITEQLVKADSDQAREGNRVQVVIPPSAQESMGLSLGEDEQKQQGATPPAPARDGPEQTDATQPAPVEQQPEEGDSGAAESE